MDTPFMVELAEGLAHAGMRVLRFEFLKKLVDSEQPVVIEFCRNVQPVQWNVRMGTTALLAIAGAGPVTRMRRMASAAARIK